METWRHRAQMNLLVDTLEEAWRDRHDFYVAGNMGLYFSQTQARNNDFRAPDVFVVLDTDRHERKSWVVWEEGGRTPNVVIELLSESTEAVDRGRKKDIYAKVLRVPIYVLFDPFTAKLEAFQLHVGKLKYHAIEPDERGWVYCDPLGLYLGVVPGVWHDVEAPWLRWIDSGYKTLPTAEERATREAERAAREAERAAREAARADAAEAEVARLRAELEKKP